MRIHLDAFKFLLKYCLAITVIVIFFGGGTFPLWLQTVMSLGLIYCLLVKLLKRYVAFWSLAAQVTINAAINQYLHNEEQEAIDTEYKEL